MDILVLARLFAEKAHKGQVRKYTGEPYVSHCISVRNIVTTVAHTDEMLCAALLHDTVEDTDATLADIKDKFGWLIAMYVDGLTDVSLPSHGNRFKRKEQDRLHLQAQCPEVKTIKLADLIDNTGSICKYDPKFAAVYMVEKDRLLDVLTEGDVFLHETAREIVDSYKHSTYR